MTPHLPEGKIEKIHHTHAIKDWVNAQSKLQSLYFKTLFMQDELEIAVLLSIIGKYFNAKDKNGLKPTLAGFIFSLENLHQLGLQDMQIENIQCLEIITPQGFAKEGQNGLLQKIADESFIETGEHFSQAGINDLENILQNGFGFRINPEFLNKNISSD